jgi:hypothetical protein
MRKSFLSEIVLYTYHLGFTRKRLCSASAPKGYIARTGYNHIEKLDFLAGYPRARIEPFQPNIIRNSFVATDIIPIDPERVLSKPSTCLRTPSPPSSQPSSRSSGFTPKTPRTLIQLEKEASMLEELHKQLSKSPPTPSEILINQIIKGGAMTMHSAAFLVKENADRSAANEKKRQKRTPSTMQIAHEGVLSIEEGLQLAQQPIQPVEADDVVSHEQGDLPTQQDQPCKRALLKCSGCGQIGHRSIIVINDRYSRIDAFWLIYHILEIYHGGGCPARQGVPIGRELCC